VITGDYSISFNAVETNVFYIDNKPIEFVNSFCHLGPLINSELSDDEDITVAEDINATEDITVAGIILLVKLIILQVFRFISAA